jgi:hypothetical protein
MVTKCSQHPQIKESNPTQSHHSDPLICAVQRCDSQCACARRCMRGGGDAGDGVSQSQAFHKHPSIIPYLNTFEPKKMSSSQSSSNNPRPPKPADRADGVWVLQQACRMGPTTCHGKGRGRVCTADMMRRYCFDEWVLLRKDGSTLRGPLLRF